MAKVVTRTENKTKVVLAVCTYARPLDLEKLLTSFLSLEIDSQTEPSVVVVDNDRQRSAEAIVANFREAFPWPVTYVHEAEPGIPFARNRALLEARNAKYLAFVDDDETVDPRWLVELLEVARLTGAEFVQGPVVMSVEDSRDSWWLQCTFFKQKRFENLGPRTESWTNNVLVDLDFVRSKGCRFDPKLRYDGGSDTLFFQDVVAAGGMGRFAAKAVVYEVQKKERLNWKWATQRQYRYGISRANTVRLRKPFSVVLPYCVASGTAMFILGTFTLLRGIVGGRVLRANGVALIARGLGVYLGFLGGRWREYAR